MIAMLMAAATAFLVTVFVTPLLIARLRRHGIGQQIRDDGPIAHPHVAKAGTPTMGGIAIVGASVIGYLFAHFRHKSVAFSSSGWTLIVLIVGLGAVGFLDDYLGVRARRNLGLRKRGKTLGIVAVAAVFAWLSHDFAHTSTHLSFTRPLTVDLGTAGWFVFAILIVYSTANAVNLTDGLDGLAAGSSAFVFAAFMIIAFTEFRHDTLYGIQRAQALDQAIVAAAMFGACAGFLWWNAAPARIIMGDTGSLAIGGAMAGLALLHAHDVAVADPRGPPGDRDALGRRPGRLVPRLSQTGAAHGADPSSLRGRRLVGVHGDRAVLALRRDLRRARDRHLLRRLPAPPRPGARVMRAVVIGLAETGLAVTRRLRSEGWDVTVVEDTPGASAAVRERAAAARALGARLDEAPAAVALAAAVGAADLVVPSPLVRLDHRRSSPRVPPVCRSAARSTSRASGPTAPIVAVTGTNGKTTVTTLTAAMLAASGRRVVAAGNLGRPLIDAVDDPVDVLVAEVSSFQLACSETFHPHVGVVLAITPDHLDWHGSYEQYVAAKARITRCQDADDVLVFDADDPDAAAIAAAGRARALGFSRRRDAAGYAREIDGRLVDTDGEPMANVDDMRRARARSHKRAGSRVSRRSRPARPLRVCAPRSRRTRPSLIASRWSAKLVGCSGTTIRRRPTPTRRCALESFDSVVLLAGGRNKGLDLSVLGRAASRSAAWSRSAKRGPRSPAFPDSVPTETVGSMHDAVHAAARLARPGDAVLLSPACASFDAYANYAERGDDFAAEVAKLMVEGIRRDRARPPHSHTPPHALAAAAGPHRDRAPAQGAAATADLRDPVRDRRRAEHRRPRDDPVGVVGRRAQRLRLVVVLLRPPAPVGGGRRRRVRRGIERRLPRVEAAGALAARGVGRRAARGARSRCRHHGRRLAALARRRRASRAAERGREARAALLRRERAGASRRPSRRLAPVVPGAPGVGRTRRCS